MKVLLIIVIVAIAMGFAGWLTVSNQGDSSSVTLQTEKIREDTKAAAEKGEELLDKATEKSREFIDESDDTDKSEEGDLEDEPQEQLVQPQ